MTNPTPEDSMRAHGDGAPYTIADEIRDDWIFLAVLASVALLAATLVFVGILMLGWWR